MSLFRELSRQDISSVSVTIEVLVKQNRTQYQLWKLKRILKANYIGKRQQYDPNENLFPLRKRTLRSYLVSQVKTSTLPTVFE